MERDLETLRRQAAVRLFAADRVPPRFVAFDARFSRDAWREGEGVVNLLHAHLLRQESGRLDLPSHLLLSTDLDLVGDAEMVFIADHAGLEREWLELGGEIDLETTSGTRLWTETVRRILETTAFSVDAVVVWRFRHQVLGRLETSRRAFAETAARMNRRLRQLEHLEPRPPSAPPRVTRATWSFSLAQDGPASIEALFEGARATRHVPLLSASSVPWVKRFAATSIRPVLEPDDLQTGALFAFLDAWTDDAPSAFSCWQTPSYLATASPSLDKSRFVKTLVGPDRDGRFVASLFLRPSLGSRLAAPEILAQRCSRALGVPIDAASLRQQGVLLTVSFDVPFRPLLFLAFLQTHPLLVDQVVFDPSSWYAGPETALDLVHADTGIRCRFAGEAKGAATSVRLSSCSNASDADRLRFLGLLMRLAASGKPPLVGVDDGDGSALPDFLSDALRRDLDACWRTAPEPTPLVVAGSGSQWGLRQRAPDIFLPKYSRHCYAVPSIVADAEEEQRIRESGAPSSQLMVFPLPGDPRSAAHPPLTYTCHYNATSAVAKKQKFIYPGLTANPLANRDLFPFTPCCFTNDQRRAAARPSRFQEYYDLGGQHRPAVTRQPKKLKPSFFVKGNRALRGPEERAPLPRHVLTVLQAATGATEWTRRGVSAPSPDAVFDALAAAGIRGVRARRDREVMAETLALTCLPWNPTRTLEEVREGMLRGPFLPSLYQPALEHFYRVQLFVFGAAAYELGRVHEGEGEWLFPRDDSVLFEAVDPSRQSVVLFQHWGAAADDDDLRHPHVELVERQTGPNVWEPRLGSDAALTFLEDVRQSMATTLQWKDDDTLVPVPPARPLPASFDSRSVVGQGLDLRNRCVALWLEPPALLELALPRPPLPGLPVVGPDLFRRELSAATDGEPSAWLDFPEGRLWLRVAWRDSEERRRREEYARDRDRLERVVDDPQAAYLVLFHRMRRVQHPPWLLPRSLEECRAQPLTSISTTGDEASSLLVLDGPSSAHRPPYVFCRPGPAPPGSLSYWKVVRHLERDDDAEPPCFRQERAEPLCGHPSHGEGAFFQRGSLKVLALPLAFRST